METTFVLEVWRRQGGSNPTPFDSTFPFGYPIQHGQLFDPSFFPVFSHPISCCALSVLLSVIVFFPSPERSFLAYAFPLLDMCNPRLGLPVSIFLFPISALSTHVLLFLSLMITHHQHITTLYLFSSISKEKKKRNPYILLFCSVLSCLL